MEELIKTLKVGFLLRSLFSGALFVLSYYLTIDGAKPAFHFLEITPDNTLSLGVAIALVAGVTIYGLHRSLLYPLIEWILNSKSAIRLRQKNWITLISKESMERLVERWDRKAEDSKLWLSRTEQFQTWADYIHLQFNSAWCLTLGAWAGGGFQIKSSFCPLEWVDVDWRLPMFVGIMVAAGFVSNWRSIAVEEYAKEPHNFSGVAKQDKAKAKGPDAKA